MRTFIHRFDRIGVLVGLPVDVPPTMLRRIDDVLALIDDAPDRRRSPAIAAAAGYRLVRRDPASYRRDWPAPALSSLTPGQSPRSHWPHPSAPGSWSSAPVPTSALPSAIGLGADHTVLLPGGDADLVGSSSEIRRPRRHPAGAIAVVSGHGGRGERAGRGDRPRSADDGARTMLFTSMTTEVARTCCSDSKPRGRPGWQDLTVERGAPSAIHVPRCCQHRTETVGSRAAATR